MSLHASYLPQDLKISAETQDSSPNESLKPTFTFHTLDLSWRLTEDYGWHVEGTLQVSGPNGTASETFLLTLLEASSLSESLQTMLSLVKRVSG